jgi:hypothetical protein
VLLAGRGVSVYFLFGRGSAPDEKQLVTPVQIDAGTGKAANQVPIDAPSMSRDDIIAISKFGFFSVDANKPTTIYVDNQRLGETPMKRLPLTPGPHKVKAVTRGKKPKEFEITIVGGRDADEGMIEW